MRHQTNCNNPMQMDPKKGFRIHFIVFVFSSFAVWIIWYFTERTYPWPLWSTGAWIVGVISHYLSVFEIGKSNSN